MSFKQLLRYIREDEKINGFIPLPQIPLLPKLVMQGDILAAEIFYLRTDTSMGRYTVYPVSYKVVYDINNKCPLSTECIQNDNTDYSTPLGAYEKLAEGSGINADTLARYEHKVEMILKNSGNVRDEDFDEAAALWRQCLPKEILCGIEA